MKKYVIIGNSAAAIGAVQGIRSVDRDGSITIITDEAYHTYSRPLISYWLEGKVADDKIYYREPDFYEKNNVKTIFSVRAEKIENGCVVLDNGEKVQYDKLLVATGSKPFVPPMKDIDKVEDKFTFMTWDSAKAIREKVTAAAPFYNYRIYNARQERKTFCFSLLPCCLYRIVRHVCRRNSFYIRR